MTEIVTGVIEHDFFTVRDKGVRLKSESGHRYYVLRTENIVSMVCLWALKYCTTNIASAKNEVVSGLMTWNILIKSLARVGEVVQCVLIHVWSRAPEVIVRWSTYMRNRLDSNLWYYRYLLSYRSCIIEYLHTQQYRFS